MQGDGNFVVYGPTGKAVWATYTGTPGDTITMQGDGNLVIYKPNGGGAAWSSGTAPSANDHLSMQTDGNLVIYSEGGNALWDYGSGHIGTPDTLSAGQTLGVGHALWSTDGRYEAVMQGDGNFVVYAPGGKALWATYTGTPGDTITMQGDGNLVVYKPNGGGAAWNSGTAPSSGDRLVMQGDDNLVIYNGSGTAIWDWGSGKLGGGGSQGQAIVAAAASQAGLPYCYDGGNQNGPGPGSGCGGANGYDCSGLTMYAVYQATGIVLPHYTGSQGTDPRGTFIASQSALQPGDLVFFGGGSMANADHVGVYAGGGEMWDANNYNVPVQEHSLAWEEGGAGGLAFDGGMRFWH
jgi:signal peptidase I